MSKLEKKIQKLLSQPNDIAYDELRYVLLGLGCVERNGERGSHVVFVHSVTGERITVPVQKPVKRCYIVQVIKMFGLKEKYDEIAGRLS